MTVVNERVNEGLEWGENRDYGREDERGSGLRVEGNG